MKSEKLLEIVSYGNFCVLNSNLQPKFYVNPIYFELQLILRNYLFFAYPDLMTKIDEIEKIAQNSFIGQFLRSEFKSATHIYVNPIHFEIQLILRNDLFSHADQN